MYICVSKLTNIGSDNASRLDGAKPLSEPMLQYFELEPQEKNMHSRKCIWKYLQNGGNFVSA